MTSPDDKILDDLLELDREAEVPDGIDRRFYTRLAEERSRGGRRWWWWAVPTVAAAALVAVFVVVPAIESPDRSKRGPAFSERDRIEPGAMALTQELELLEEYALLERYEDVEAFALLADLDDATFEALVGGER